MMETAECVKEILDSILERPTDQADESETHLTMEEVDVLHEKNKSEDTTLTEIQDGSRLPEGTSDEMFENFLDTCEVCNSGTENTLELKVVATDDSESTDFRGQNGLKQDVSEGIEEEFSGTAVVVEEHNTNMEEGLENGEPCVVEGYIHDPKQKCFGIDSQLDCVDVVFEQKSKTEGESDNGTFICGVQHEDQQSFVEEQSDKVVDVIERGSERNGHIKYAAPVEILKNDDEECGEDGKGKDVKTDDNIHYDWQGEALKLSSKEQINANEGKGEIEDLASVLDDMCPQVSPNFCEHDEDASFDASVEEFTGIVVVNPNKMEGIEKSSLRENGQGKGNQGSLEILDSPPNCSKVAEQDKTTQQGAAYLVGEGNQHGDEEQEEIAEEADSYNVNDIDQKKTEDMVECNQKDETSYGGRGHSKHVQDCQTDTMKQTSLSCGGDIASDFDEENMSVNKARLEMECANISTEKTVLHDFVLEVALRDEPLKCDDEDLDID